MTFNQGQWNSDRTTPRQFTGRVAVLGAVALLAFTAIFFRLWYLQVLSGDSYLAEAENNRVREVTVAAPRGEIRDRNGKVLVGNREALALQLRVDELPGTAARKADLISRLSGVADIRGTKIRKEIKEQTEELPGSPVTLRRDVPIELVYYLRENQQRFPGVSVDRVFVRRYPQGSLAAHTFGYVREIGPEQLAEPTYEGLIPGDEIGRDGVELAYDQVLRGLSGTSRVQVDAAGMPSGRETAVREPEPGNDLLLTIDAGLQEVGESALGSLSLPGAFVAMDARNGEILGMGSSPTFDPSLLAKPEISQATSETIFGDPDDATSTGAPAFNRAIAGAYPTGSTFKPFTALAALDAGYLDTGETIVDDGLYEVGDQEFRNAQDAVFGPLQLREALKVSSDVFFYTLGARAEDDGSESIQKWAKQLGLGSETGIDIPGEAPGLVPTPDWRNDLYRQGLTDRPWSVGDSINLSVGQGDVQADPLQMATAYAAIGNGGTVVTPHVALRAEDPAGDVVQQVSPSPKREVAIEPAWRSAIMDGLRDSSMEPGGTSYPIFGGFPFDVAGKTGTAERPPNGDQSWFVAMAPADDPEIVVAVTVEQGGFGADSAAPVAAQILTEHFAVEPDQIDDVAAETASSDGTVVYE